MFDVDREGCPIDMRWLVYQKPDRPTWVGHSGGRTAVAERPRDTAVRIRLRPRVAISEAFERTRDTPLLKMD